MQACSAGSACLSHQCHHLPGPPLKPYTRIGMHDVHINCIGTHTRCYQQPQLHATLGGPVPAVSTDAPLCIDPALAQLDKTNRLRRRHSTLTSAFRRQHARQLCPAVMLALRVAKKMRRPGRHTGHCSMLYCGRFHDYLTQWKWRRRCMASGDTVSCKHTDATTTGHASSVTTVGIVVPRIR